MSTIPFIQFYPGDYLRDTQHLTTEQHGAYFLLMMAAWSAKQCRLPNDDTKLARIAGVGVRKWRAIKPDVLAFWTVDGDHIYQERLLFERNEAEVKHSRRVAAGRKGGEAKSLKTQEVTPSNATDLPQAKETQSPSKSEPEPYKEKKEGGAEDDLSRDYNRALQRLGLGDFPNQKHLAYIERLRSEIGVESSAEDIAAGFAANAVKYQKPATALTGDLRLWVFGRRDIERRFASRASPSKAPWEIEDEARKRRIQEALDGLVE